MPGPGLKPQQPVFQAPLSIALPLDITILPARGKTGVATTNRKPSSVHSLVFLWKHEEINGCPSPTPSNSDYYPTISGGKKNCLKDFSSFQLN